MESLRGQLLQTEYGQNIVASMDGLEINMELANMGPTFTEEKNIRKSRSGWSCQLTANTPCLANE
jgi:hypothetical protein